MKYTYPLFTLAVKYPLSHFHAPTQTETTRHRNIKQPFKQTCLQNKQWQWDGSWVVLKLLQQYIYWFSDNLLTICILQAQEIQGRWLDNYLNAWTFSLCLNQVRPILVFFCFFMVCNERNVNTKWHNPVDLDFKIHELQTLFSDNHHVLHV